MDVDTRYLSTAPRTRIAGDVRRTGAPVAHKGALHHPDEKQNRIMRRRQSSPRTWEGACTVLVTVSSSDRGERSLQRGRNTRERDPHVCVPGRERGGGSQLETWEPFRAPSRRRRAAVVVSESRRRMAAGFDLYVMPVWIISRTDPARVDVLFEIGSAQGRRTGADVVERTRGEELAARGSADAVDFSSVDPGDIAFADPRSVNGYWVQAGGAHRTGLEARRRGREPPVFEGPAGRDPMIFAVLLRRRAVRRVPAERDRIARRTRHDRSTRDPDVSTADALHVHRLRGPAGIRRILRKERSRRSRSGSANAPRVRGATRRGFSRRGASRRSSRSRHPDSSNPAPLRALRSRRAPERVSKSLTERRIPNTFFFTCPA